MSINELVPTITRFGTALFLIFAISVLLNIFKYLMRLAAYHDARADALELCRYFEAPDIERLSCLAKVLNAETLDFGKAPDTPLKQVIEIAKVFKGDPKSDKE
jgi:hypothetical protein